MNCPECGKLASANQRFCRSCGFNLEGLQQWIAQQRQGENQEEQQAASADAIERARGRHLLRALLLGLISAVLLACVWALFRGGSAGVPELLLILLLGVGDWFALSAFRSSSRGLRKLQSRMTQEVGVKKDTARSLSPGDGSPVMNLTESTTKLIHSEKRGDTAD